MLLFIFKYLNHLFLTNPLTLTYVTAKKKNKKKKGKTIVLQKSCKKYIYTND